MSGSQVAHRKRDDPEKQRQCFVDRFDPQIRPLIRGIRRALHKRLPTANELVYDNYNFFVIGYSPSDRPSHVILSIAADAHGVRLACPCTGAKLPDRHHLLAGSGNQNRSLRISDPDLISSFEVEALISASIRTVKVPLNSKGKGQTIIRSVPATQRPRRKEAN